MMQILSLFLYFQAISAKQNGTSLSTLDSKHIPEAHGWSGGWCLASMAEAGWLRSAIINPMMADVLLIGSGNAPVATGSNSGGSMFATRYYTYRSISSAVKWNYPCYLLHDPYMTACYFHGGFGAVSSECASERFNVVSAATSAVYGPTAAMYGGPMGVASVYASIYFPFLADLPLAPAHRAFESFANKYILFSTVYQVPANWLVAHSLSSPVLAGQNLYNFGFDSYLARSVNAYNINDAGVQTSHFNVTVMSVVAASANIESGAVMLPFALAGKSWDGLTAGGPLGPAMKLFSLVIQFLMIKKLLLAHTIMNVADYVNVPACKGGCPIMDGGFTDNGPLTVVVAAGSKVPESTRPVWMLSVGAQATMSTVKYLMGTGTLKVWTFSGVNVCPFTVAGICTILSKVRELAVQALPPLSQTSYYSLGNAYQVYRPEIKLLAPYCGDPLTYDLFEARCAAEGMCDMWTTIIPSSLNDVKFTADTYILVFVMAFLDRTPVSARFVKKYLPQDMWNIMYYEHMDDWFPNFDALAPQKGGIGFTNLAGNSFMDFMTYLNLRLVGFTVHSKNDAWKMTHGDAHPVCDYTTYEAVDELSLSEPEFRVQQQMR